jgi:hypothetical protein
LFVPPNSPLKHAGQNGSDIGANILYEYVNGQLTNQPLWPWPMEDRIKAETGFSVTWASGGGFWKTLTGVYGSAPVPTAPAGVPNPSGGTTLTQPPPANPTPTVYGGVPSTACLGSCPILPSSPVQVSNVPLPSSEITVSQAPSAPISQTSITLSTIPIPGNNGTNRNMSLIGRLLQLILQILKLIIQLLSRIGNGKLKYFLSLSASKCDNSSFPNYF